MKNKVYLQIPQSAQVQCVHYKKSSLLKNLNSVWHGELINKSGPSIWNEMSKIKLK